MSTSTSPRHGWTTPHCGRTVSWLLDLRARQRPDHPFLRWEPFDGEAATWTYRAFAAAVARAAGGLRRGGVTPGDTVLVHLDNCPELLLTWFACARLGAVAVCTSTRSSHEELAYFAGHSGAVAAVTEPARADAVARAAPGLRSLVPTGDLPALLAGAPAAAVAPDPMAPVCVQYTSGTTARPKGVVWTHANALWAAQVNAARERLTGADVHLVFLPLFHANALAYSVLPTLWAGATAVLQPRFSASRFWEVSRRNRCTWASHVSFTLRALAAHDGPAIHDYRLWGCGVCAHPAGERFGVPVIGWWGMTETVATPIAGEVENPNRPGSMGRATPEYEVAVVRADGSPVEPGEPGELLVRGRPGVSLFARYLHDPAATAEAFDADGWFRTGDLVVPDAEGWMTFSDRAKDMLKVGGENVAASEIERVVAEVPGVAEVAVVGGPDPMLDEVPVAFVVARGPQPLLPQAILAACRARLADFKVPRSVRLVDELPRSTLQKVAKHELRRALRAGE